METLINKIIDKCSLYDLLLIVIVVGVILNTLIKSWKGRNNIFQDILFSIKDSLNYFTSEPDGNIVQKINAGFGFCIITEFSI